MQHHPSLPITVDELGVVRNIRGRILKGSPTSKVRPYLRVCLRINKVPSYHLLHRLVAETRLPNPDNKEQVNHKDGDRVNNHPDNLEWVTPSENMLHAWATGLQVCSEYSRQCSAERMRAAQRLRWRHATID